MQCTGSSRCTVVRPCQAILGDGVGFVNNKNLSKRSRPYLGEASRAPRRALRPFRMDFCFNERSVLTMSRDLLRRSWRGFLPRWPCGALRITPRGGRERTWREGTTDGQHCVGVDLYSVDCNGMWLTSKIQTTGSTV